MVIPVDKETKHIKDQNVDTQGYSEYEITKIKNRVYQLNVRESTLGPLIK